MPDNYCLADDIIKEFRNRKLEPKRIISLLSKLSEDTREPDRNTWNRCVNKPKPGVSRDRFKRLCEVINLYTKWNLTYARFCCERRRADFLGQEEDALAQDYDFWKERLGESAFESLIRKNRKKFGLEKSLEPDSAQVPPEKHNRKSSDSPPMAASGTKPPAKSDQTETQAVAELSVDPWYPDDEERKLPPRRKKNRGKKKNTMSGGSKTRAPKNPRRKLLIGSLVGGIAVALTAAALIYHDSISSTGLNVVAEEPKRDVATPPILTSSAPSAQKTVELVLEAQRQTIADIQKRLPRAYRQLVETEITGLSEIERKRFLQQTSRSRASLTNHDAIYQPAVASGTRPVTLSINGDLGRDNCFWYRINADGIGRMIPGSFGKQQITLGNRSQSYRLLLVVLAPDTPPPAISVAVSRAPVLLVPTYFYPDSDVEQSEYWAQFRRMADVVRGQAQICVVLNIFNGSGKVNPVDGEPGQYPDANYKHLIAELNQQDIPWLAYLTRMQGKPRHISLQEDFRLWKKAYPTMAGLFIDDVESDQRGVNGLRDFCRYARASFTASGNASPMLVANCGVPCNTDLTAADMFNWVCIDETSVAASRFARPANSPSRVRYGALLHSAESDGQVRERMQELLTAGADFLFLTDEIYSPNEGVWKKMPTDSIVDAMSSVLEEHQERQMSISDRSLLTN